jgi:hypothetical protein
MWGFQDERQETAERERDGDDERGKDSRGTAGLRSHYRRLTDPRRRDENTVNCPGATDVSQALATGARSSEGCDA